MNINRLTGIVILILALIVGCSGTDGKITKQTDTSDKVTLAELSENWDDYDIYYTMRSGRWAAAIMFDPKDNDKKLIGDSWIKIEDQESLSESIRQVRIWSTYARVDTIEGPDNQFFGYMFYPYWLQVPVRVVDERTLYVSALPGFGSAP
jgi:hypothetical protein